MNNLIKALQIFSKYKDLKYPTCCEHDILLIMAIEKDEVTIKDALELTELGFFWSDEYDCWASYRFGSA